MKLYKDERGIERVMEWSIVFEQDRGSIRINAVDSITGGFITGLLVFTPKQGLIARDNAGGMLNDAGYDTHQNGNAFNSDTGNIWMRNEGELE